MASFRKAVQTATRRARETGETHFVVFDFDGSDERSYHAASEEELATFFCGADPKAVCDSSGEVEIT